MEITYKSKDESIEIKLVYIVKHRFHRYSIGKSWPKHTQCLLFVDGLLLGFGEVVKHNQDEDNQEFAYKKATQKILHLINLREIRKELWNKVLNEIKK